jgi:predicted small integral membrane protein
MEISLVEIGSCITTVLAVIGTITGMTMTSNSELFKKACVLQITNVLLWFTIWFITFGHVCSH